MLDRTHYFLWVIGWRKPIFMLLMQLIEKLVHSLHFQLLQGRYVALVSKNACNNSTIKSFVSFHKKEHVIFEETWRVRDLITTNNSRRFNFIIYAYEVAMKGVDNTISMLLLIDDRSKTLLSCFLWNNLANTTLSIYARRDVVLRSRNFDSSECDAHAHR